jgi:hypothetical protein
MAVQKEVNLNEPLNKDAKASLEQMPLTPDLAQAALILHGDYFRQMQAKCNRFLFWHPVLMAFVTVCVSVFAYVQLHTILEESSSAAAIVRHEDFVLRAALVLPSVVCFVGCVGILSYLLSDDFRTISDKLDLHAYILALFGFNLRTFAQFPIAANTKEQKKALKHGDNTNLIVYRGSPIAVATVKAGPSTKDQLEVQITGLHVRKVFAKVDFDNLLVDWAIARAYDLARELGHADSKVTVVIDAYNFDTERVKLLKHKFFKRQRLLLEFNPFVEVVAAEAAIEQSSGAPTKRALFHVPVVVHQWLGLHRDTYALTLSKRK